MTHAGFARQLSADAARQSWIAGLEAAALAMQSGRRFEGALPAAAARGIDPTSKRGRAWLAGWLAYVESAKPRLRRDGTIV